jgi:hypothetical protein
MTKKKVDGSFETRELTCSVFAYSLADFKKLKASKVVSEWEEDLNDNSSSYPVYVGSPFDTKGLGLKTSIDESPESKTVYAIPHYFYSSGEYAIEEPIDGSYEIKLAPIVGELLEDGPMDWAEKDGEQVYFEGQGATDGSEFAVNFYWGKKLVGTALLSDVDDDVLAQVAKKCV